MNLRTENYFWKNGYQNIAGLDEAGRGPLAGPVVAAAVIINPEMTAKLSSPPRIKCGVNSSGGSKTLSPRKRGIPAFSGMTSVFKTLLQQTRDSKKLSPKKREMIFRLIRKCPYIRFSYCLVSEKIIDRINIEQATFRAMRNCLKGLKKKYRLTPDLVLIDGNRSLDHYFSCPQKTIVKGDNKILSIALASIIAKVIRDKKMATLSKKYPKYHFEIHKGYPTKLHKQLLKKYGLCKVHRKSYKPVKLISQNSKGKRQNLKSRV